MTQHPYAATTYEVFLATPRRPGFDWHTAGTGSLADLDLGLRLAYGLEPMLAVVRAIDSGRVPGRQVDWCAWLGPVSLVDAEALVRELGWAVPPELAGLDPDGSYVLVAVET